MKKTLSIVLTLCMLVSLIALPTFAAGTVAADYKPADGAVAVTNEAEFLAMAADGNYYLANDITITKSYESLFKGTFDGCGKTVTVSEPMFLKVAGTVKNFTVNGEIVATHEKENGYWARGAVACVAAEGTKVVFENITNNANVTGFLERDTDAYPTLLGYAYGAGIVGGLDNDTFPGATSIEVINCVNNGAIKSYHAAGGITGAAYVNDADKANDLTVTYTNCVNNGSVDSVASYAGGIVARILYTYNATITGCINNGDVKGLSNTAGIVGHTTASIAYISFCQNNGFISNYSKDGETPYAGGILGYGQGTKNAEYEAGNGYYANKVEFCINNGDILGDARTGGVVASFGASGAYGLSVANYCINTGNVTSRGIGDSAAANSAGGVVGYGYGSGKKEYTVVTNCITTGNVESKGESKGVAAYFLAYINSPNATIANCSALGTLTSAAGNTFSIGWNNKSAYTAETVNNTVPAGCTYNAAYESQAVSTRDFALGATDATSLTSGALVYALNQAYKAATGSTADVVYMTINGTDFVPTLIPEVDDKGNVLNSVVVGADGSFTNPTPVVEEETTAAPEETTSAPVEDTTAAAPETTEPPVSGETGDTAVIFAAIAIIALAGVAVVAKKKEN